jgi:hypothetical protein
MKTLFLLLACLVIGSCSEKPTETTPPIDDEANLPAGRRDYEWTVMEITPLNYDYFFSITGTSPQNVYAGGGQGLWHFNGESWSKVSDTFLHGISATPSGKVWGVELSKAFLYEPQRAGQPMIESKDFTGAYPDYPNVILNNVWSDADNNVFVYGYAYKTEDQRLCVAFIAHFNGSTWTTHPITKIPNNIPLILFRDTQSSNTYLISCGENDENGFVPFRRYTIFKLKFPSNQAERLYESPIPRVVWNIGRNTLYMDTCQAFTYDKGRFNLWKDFSEYGYRLSCLFGRHSKDMFSYKVRDVGYDLVHYNGEDLAMIYEGNTNPQDFSQMYQMLVYEKDIFILSERNPAHGNYKTIIIHGKLK